MRFVAAILSLAAIAVAQPRRELLGKVVTGEGNAKTATPNLEVILEETGNRVITNSDGFFRFPLPDFLQSGTEVTISVSLSGFAIYLPTAGKQRIPAPADLLKTRIEIQLLPNTSPRFYTPERLAAMVARAASNAAVPTSPSKQAVPPIANQKLEEIAKQNGLLLELLQTAIARWSTGVESDANKARSLDPALVAYAKQDFAEAKERANTAAEALVADAVSGKAPPNSGEIARAFQLAGDSAYSEGSFQEASDAYRNTLKRVPPESDPVQWALLNLKLGNSELEIGFRHKEDARSRLEAAADSYRSALKVYTSDGTPDLWAGTQFNLAVALGEIAYADPKSAVPKLTEAVAVSNDSLKVYTKERNREGWARVQRNLGTFLGRLALLRGGSQAADLFSRSVQSYESALEFFDRDVDPQEWAITQKDLGLALMQQMSAARPEEALAIAARAEKALRSALGVLRMEDAGEDWAAATFNLAGALIFQAVSSPPDTARPKLKEAADCYRASLSVYTKESVPGKWGETQYDLAIAYQELADRSQGSDKYQLLDQAVTATERALEVFRQNTNPPRWALTQYSLGNLLRDQAALAPPQNQRGLLARSISAYERALMVYTPEVSRQYNDLFQQRLEETRKRFAALP